MRSSVASEMMVVVASKSLETAKCVQRVVNSPKFRIYVTDDVVGVEVGGALKNPLAIGAGMASGLGYGQSLFMSQSPSGTQISKKTLSNNLLVMISAFFFPWPIDL